MGALEEYRQSFRETFGDCREDEQPEDLEAKMNREHAKAMEKAQKPKTLNEMLEEYDQETADDEN